MKGLLKLAFLAAYSFSIFFIGDAFVLALMALGNLALSVIAGVSPRKALANLLAMAPFIALAALINLLAGSVRGMVLVAARLVLVCNLTFVFRSRTSGRELAAAMELLFRPARIFGVDPREPGLMVSIALAFIPVLGRELEAVTRALRARGMKPGLRVLRPFLLGALKRTGEMERALRSKNCAGSDT